MELIIKPTGKCNFNCKFCAASSLDISHTPKHVPDRIKETIDILKPDGIIITGGEPLCCEPEYYEELLTMCDCNIVFTTNLKDFWLHPYKWIPLFKNDRIRVGTSFNYGNGRRWDKDTVYDEKMFRDVMSLFRENMGYTPPFIAVITEENEDAYLKHVLLAKELDTYCRLNNALKMGRSGSYYPRYKIFKMWLDVINKGLEDYEQNCFERSFGICPINSSGMCQSCIRAIYVDGDQKVHYADCEDKLNRNDNCEIEIDKVRPIPKLTPVDHDQVITKNCLYCELCNICNGCATNRENAREDPNYCREMLKLKNDIISAGWKLS